MKSQDLSKSLRAFARLLDEHSAQGIVALAAVFEGGKAEPVSARVKRILTACRGSAEQPTYPAALKRDVAFLEAGFSCAGAKAQAKDLRAVLSLFEGSGSATLNAFISRIVEARDAPRRKAKAHEQTPDRAQAKQLADDLAAAVLDVDAFPRIARSLEDAKAVTTPTLGVVANLFLGNSKIYKSRKPAIDDILKRHRDDLRSHARGKALDRIGV